MTDLATIEEAVIFFQDLGFFAGSALSPADLARSLVSCYEEEWGKPFDPTHKWADLHLLRYDTSRVWWRDIEGMWYQGENAYLRTLVEWGAISRGAFQPVGGREWWDGGRVIISFMMAGEPRSISAQDLGDYLDTSILVGLNKMIRSTGSECRLEAYDTDDTSLFLAVLTPSEKRTLQKRGWRFQVTHL